MAIESRNPATDIVLKRFEELSAEQTDEALSSVAVAYDSWKQTSFAHRAACLRSLAEAMQSRRDEYARIMADEMGKPLSFGRAEIDKCAAVCEFYAKHGEAMLTPEALDGVCDKAVVEYAPMGTVLAVMPWNFPFWQVLRIAAPTLMAGNTMVLKHASNVPQCALAIEEAFKASDFPEDVFRTLLVGAGQVESILDHESVVGVSLTGSEGAGRKVAAAAGARLKKSVMELGGSDPLVVLADADISKAARVGALSRCANAGQTCIASKRFIVHQDVYQDFIDALSLEMNSLKIGDPLEEGTQIGPMASQALRDELQSQVDRCVEAGAVVVQGGSVPEGDGAYYPPTILTDLPFASSIGREELFGPVALVFKAEDEGQAIAMANDTPFGLGGSIWTRDEEKGFELASQIESGVVFVNGLVRSSPSLPFGGIKNSGYGRELGSFGIREFVNIKSICLG